MGLFYLFGAALFGASAQGLVFTGPRPTDSTDHLNALAEDGWTPVPTPGPGIREVLRRQDSLASTYLVAPDNTCGFISGRESGAYTCGQSNLRCAFIPSSAKIPGAAGCCNGSQCAFRVSCLDREDLKSCDKSCQADTMTLKCSGSARFCNTVAFPLGVTDYYCATRRIASVQKAETTHSGQRSRSMVSTVIGETTSTSTKTSTSSKPSSGSSTSSPPETASSDAVSSTTSSSATDSTSAGAATTSADLEVAPAPSAPVGAIVGGILGGIALLALIIFGTVFLRQRQLKRLQALQAQGPSPSAGQQPPMSQPPFQPQPPANPFADPPPPSPYSSQAPPSPAISAVSAHQSPVRAYGTAATAAAAAAGAASAAGTFRSQQQQTRSNPRFSYEQIKQPPQAQATYYPQPPAYDQDSSYPYPMQDETWLGLGLGERQQQAAQQSVPSTPVSTIHDAIPVTPASALSTGAGGSGIGRDQSISSISSGGRSSRNNLAAAAAGGSGGKQYQGPGGGGGGGDNNIMAGVPLILQPGMGMQRLKPSVVTVRRSPSTRSGAVGSGSGS